jgi:WD40 repeat protein/uncharacterized protein with von Willebrand factor type A (vWA) domain
MNEDYQVQLPLQELFNRLRKAGLPLGIDEYKLALYAIQSGYGMKDYEALARLCRTLWVKSEEEKLLFNYHFEQVIAETAQVAEPELIPILPEEPEPKKKKRFISLSGLSLTRRLVWGGTLLLVTGVSLLLIRPQPKKCPYFTSFPINFPLKGKEYSYEVKAQACKVDENDKLKITALEIPPWLQVKEDTDGKFTLIGKLEGSFYYTASVLDLSGKTIGKFQHPAWTNDYSDRKLALISSPDGSYFATLERNNIVRLWNLSGKQIGKDLQHFGQVNDITFSPDNQRLATASGDGLVRLWDTSGKLRGKLKHQEPVWDIIFSPDNQRLVTTSAKNNIFESDTNNEASRFSIQPDYDDSKTYLWDLSSQKKLADLGKNTRRFTAFSSNGQRLITIFFEDSSENSLRKLYLRLWDTSGKKLAESNFSEKQLRNYYPNPDIGLSPDGQHIAITARDRVILLDILSGNQLAQLRHRDVNNVKFSPDGQRIVTTSYNDRNPRLWEPYKDPNGKQVRFLRHQGSVESVSFNPDGRLLATTTNDTIHLWDISRNELQKLLFTGIPADTISFSPDGKRLIATSRNSNHTIKLQVSDESGRQNIQAFTFNIGILEEPSSNRNTKLGQYLTYTALIALLILLPGGYIIARYFLQRIATRIKEVTQSSEPTPTPTASTTEKKRSPEDVLQVVQAVRQTTKTELDEYFPVTRRQMKQSWRYLRRFVREGPATELDVETTVKQFARQGLLLTPALMRRRVNRAELLLLVDRDGSMIPFHALSRRLAETSAQGGRLAKAEVYYFHNCPAQVYQDSSSEAQLYIYQDPSCCEAKKLVDILANYSDSAGVLIFSDAGAARGGWNQERVNQTAKFIQQIKHRVRYIAWLNPMPQTRWNGTTADEIASLVPMFEFSRQGLHQAIAVLRGKFTPYRV